MKINEITEHLNFNPKKISWLDDADTISKLGWKLKQSIKTSHGTYSVFGLKKGPTIQFVIKNDSGDALLYAELWHYKDNIYQFKKLQRNKNLETKGLIQFLLKILVQDYKFKIFSDDAMSSDGTRFWKSLAHSPIGTLVLYDKKLDADYSLNQVGSFTKDGIQIVLPENDDQTYVTNTGERISEDDYRFYYLIYPVSTSVVVESLNKNYGIDDEEMFFGCGVIEPNSDF